MQRKMSADKMAHDIENQLDNLSDLFLERCIYRVPKRLRQVNEKAYTPQVVSIGPLHHGEEPLKAMEEHKLRYLRHFLSQTGVRLFDYIQKIQDQEERLRGFYAEPIVFDKDEFVRIVSVDAAFVIDLLLRLHYSNYREEDYIFSKPTMISDVIRDLKLLENQLPFFILQDLFKLIPPQLQLQLPSLLEISYNFFQSVIDSEGKKKKFDKISSSGVEVKHFVDLIRILYLPLEPKKKPETTATPETTDTPKTTWCDRMLMRLSHSIFLTSGYTPNTTATPETTDTPKTTSTPETTDPHETTDKPKTTDPPETTDKPNITATPNVTELHQAGAKFKVGKGSSLFDIKFSRGILEIPKLRVDDTTDLKLRNILAFEQCHHREEDYLAYYVFLMKRLAKTPEDVQLLLEKGIIENWLGDTQKISTLLHDLGTGMIVDDWYYAPLCKKLIKYRKQPWHEWMVILKQEYFNTPWASISVVAAVILLILTVVQTACSIKSVPL
ncbi:hypothetical protein D8674_042115 [Pyrus ussuriensis x Pyrus communis]|uniref:Uncharacterized protein n=1 Tax=Pyrus ussuriensis x Pyrus communis TaxID=2448454 RepID=A0A5N5HAZ5_9ROSA|nr:hypothetical protein D8674_042115 [Pyrus ussuriensis x Pyrus communis]